MKNYNVKMNLQLFADPSASLQNTTGTLSGFWKFCASQSRIFF